MDLALDCQERRVLGDDVVIDISAVDETNTRVKPERIARQIARAGGRGLVALVGVQTNQFPRAMDIARRLRAAGVEVCDRRLSCLRLPCHVAGFAAGAQGGDGPGRLAVRGRG
jgi:hypothetical protein